MPEKLTFADYDRRQNLRRIPDQTSVLGGFMLDTTQRVLCIAMFRYPAWILTRILPVRISPLVTLISYIATPLAVIELHNRAATHDDAIYLYGAAGYFVALMILAYVFPRIAWLGLIATSDDVDLLFAHPADRESYIEYVRKALRYTRQVALSVVATALAIAALAIMAPQIVRLPLPLADSHLAGAVLIWFMANIVYWLWNVPAFIGALLRAKELRLSSIAPAYTPAVLALSRLLGTSALLALLAASIIVTPALIYLSWFGSPFVLAVAVSVTTLGMLTVLFVGIAPQLWLARMVRRHKEKTLHAISEEFRAYTLGLPMFPNEQHVLSRTFVLLTLHQQVQQAPILVAQSDLLTKYLAAFLSALSPIVTLALKYASP